MAFHAKEELTAFSKSGVFRHSLSLWRGLPLSRAEVRNLKNTVWKAPFGTLQSKWKVRKVAERKFPGRFNITPRENALKFLRMCRRLLVLAYLREAPLRFSYGLGMERFKRFRFSVLVVPLQKWFSVFQYSLTGENGSGFVSCRKRFRRFRFRFRFRAKTVPTVPVSSSGSVPEPPCYLGKRIPLKIDSPEISEDFSMLNPHAKSVEKITKVFWKACQVTQWQVFRIPKKALWYICVLGPAWSSFK